MSNDRAASGPEAAIAAEAISGLALRLHTVRSRAAILDELGSGLSRLGMCFVLYQGDPGASEMSLLRSSLPESVEFPDRQKTADVATILAGAPKLVASDSAALPLDPHVHFRLVSANLAAALQRGQWAVLPLPTPAERTGFLLVLGTGLNEADVPRLSILVEQLSAALDRIDARERLLVLERRRRDDEETFDAISDGICVRDRSCRIVRANRTLADMIGLPVTQIIGARLCDKLPELQPTCNVCHAPAAWDELHVEHLGQAAEVLIQGPDPRLMTVKDFPARVADEGIVLWVTLIEDVTNERRLQDALVRSEKLRALGEMASGVAHDFNNLLSTILHRSELSLSVDVPPPVRRALETIHHAALDGVATVRRIQEYSRVRHDMEQRSTDLREALQAAIELSRHKWRDDPARAGVAIDLIADLQPAASVRGNPSELREVFVNLIFNAVDAMPAGGTITIRTKLHGENAVVDVADTGVGMTREVQERVFDPFFTTKGERGNGLGLSVSYGIVGRSGGQLRVTSTPGQGTTFSVWLPLAGGPSEAPVEDNSLAPTLGAIVPARILFIDDDPEVREAVVEVLRGEGHQVEAFGEAHQALASYHPGQFDCIITDLGMPGFDGWAFAHNLRAVDSSVPLIVMSGWRAELTDEQIAAHGVSAVLPKPCTRAELRRAIASLTRGAPAMELRVLVVDDQAEFAEALADRLRLDRCEVITAPTGSAGLREAEAGLFDLAIVDLGLPDVSGLRVAESMRTLPYRPYVVLTTGMAVAPGDPALLGNADDVLPKPCQAAELQAVLEKARARQQRLGARP